jgi:hypothetical protein
MDGKQPDDDGLLYTPETARRPVGTQRIVACAALLAAVLQVAAAEESSDEPVVEFKHLLRATRVVATDIGRYSRVSESEQLSGYDDGPDGPDGPAGPEGGADPSGLNHRALRGPDSTTDPGVCEMRALILVVAAHEEYRDPLFGCIAYVVCRRLLIKISAREGNGEIAHVDDAYDRLRGVHARSGGPIGALTGLKRAFARLVDAEVGGAELVRDLEKLILDVHGIAKTVGNVLNP